MLALGILAGLGFAGGMGVAIGAYYGYCPYGTYQYCPPTTTTVPNPHLIVIKHVDNLFGGSAVASDFTMTINGVTATGGNSFPGQESPGTNKEVTPGSYSVTETGPPDYAITLSAGCAGTIAPGETKTCTVVNRAKEHNPPFCDIKAIYNGPPKKLIIKTQDTQSGLLSIIVDKSQNANTPVPPFVPGTTSEVDVTSTKIIQWKTSIVELTVTDVDGNVTHCDPLLTTVKVHRKLRGGKRPVTQTFIGVPQAESKLLIQNGRPGLRRLSVWVNGRVFWFNRLGPRQELRYDVAKAMRPGIRNTIRLRGYGRYRASADILLSG